MSFTLLSVLTVCLFFVVAFIEMYGGARKGFYPALLALGADAAALLLSFFVTAGLSGVAASHILKYAQGVELYVLLTELLPSLPSVLSAALTMLIGTVLYLFVFLLCRLGVRMAVKRVCRARGGETEDPRCSRDCRVSRARGAVCGLLSAWMVTAAVSAPVMGSLVLADNALCIVKQTSSALYGAVGEENAAFVHRLTGDIATNVFYRLGGETVYAGAGSTYVSGKKVCLLSETETLASMSEDMLNVYTVFLHPENASEEHVQALRRLSENIHGLTLCEEISAELIGGCADAWQRGERFLSLCGPKVHPVWRSVFDGILDVCENVTASDVKRNTATMLEAYALMLGSGADRVPRGNAEELFRVIADGGVLEELETLLQSNSDTAHIRVSGVAMTVFASVVSGGADVQRVASDTAVLLAEINGSDMAAEEKEQRLSEHLQTVLAQRGLEASASFTRHAAHQILRELPGWNVDAGDVLRLLEKYNAANG